LLWRIAGYAGKKGGSAGILQVAVPFLLQVFLVKLLYFAGGGAFLLKQAGVKAGQADSGAVTLIQRFGSAAHLMMQPQYPRCASDCFV